MIARRRLGKSDLEVSPIGFGCWPIAGVSTLDVNDEDSLATIEAAFESGINFFDTAYGYGLNGEADYLLRKILPTRRSEMVLASKVGIGFDDFKHRVVDCRPETLVRQAEQVLQRLDVTEVEVMYLHAVDPNVPIEDSAGAIQGILDRGWARYAGVSNVSCDELHGFMRECAPIVVQPPFNMLQQTQVEEIRELCDKNEVGIVSYWALMKGLLTGKFARDHQFDPRDKRLTYEIFQGEAWRQSQDFLDELRRISLDLGCSVPSLVLAWTMRQPGICSALCGAKRPGQIRETAEAMHLVLSDSTLEEINSLISRTEIGV